MGGCGRVTLNSSSCAQCIVKSNQLKRGRLEKRQVYCRAMQGDGWLLKIHKGFQESLYYSLVREGVSQGLG